MNEQVAAKYGPALMVAGIGTIEPVYVAIGFGMVTGWLAAAGIMYEQRKPLGEIGRALIVSMLIGGGGALAAAMAVRELHLDPLAAAMVAFGIALGGARSIKLIAAGAGGAAGWVIKNLANDAERLARKREEAQKMLIENTRADHERMQRRIEQGDDA